MLQAFLSAHATIVLLLANLAISIAAFNNPRLLDSLLLYARPILGGRQLYRVISSGFIHGDPLHLFVNLLTLFFIGPYLELTIGAANFVMLYFASLLAGSGWALMENVRNPEYRALGASGAISGVTAAFALFEPLAIFFVFFIPMPAIVFAVVYIAWSAYASGRIQDGIGHAAHLGGALMGVALVCLIWPGVVRQSWTDILFQLGL
jgi:membrane associated rhomboid family serine protease